MLVQVFSLFLSDKEELKGLGRFVFVCSRCWEFALKLGAEIIPAETTHLRGTSRFWDVDVVVV